jgi:hypothetical protein
MSPIAWKKGRGKLGPLAPLLGEWVAQGDSPVGPYRCVRRFAPTLEGAYVQLTARWELGARTYEELSLYGADAESRLVFWSFTSDGKSSRGVLVDGGDVHPEAVAFEAEMPAGTARMIYWPDEREGFRWAVESKTKKGWNRFSEHHYTRQE